LGLALNRKMPQRRMKMRDSDLTNKGLNTLQRGKEGPMSEGKDAYEVGIFTGGLYSSMMDCHTLRTQKEGIVIDLKTLRREGVQIQIEVLNMDFFQPYSGPLQLINFHIYGTGRNNKILKISGKLFGVEGGTIIMHQDPLKIEFKRKDIWEEAKAEVAEETKREKIDDIKQKLRTRKSFWDRVWPWSITIRRK
jgi:hypothetical protein